MFKLPNSLLILLFSVIVAVSQEPNLAVRSMGGGIFGIGLVTLEKTSRIVTIPAVVNMRSETVEYALVHKTGKTHESIFRTEARPQDIQMAMLLLNAQPAMTNSFGLDGKGLPQGDAVTIEVNWTNQNTSVRYPIEDVVLNKQTSNTLARGAWIYNGSNFSEDMFTAQRDGSIISIHIDPDALINNARPGRENDELYMPNAGKLPPIGTQVAITIRLHSAK